MRRIKWLMLVSRLININKCTWPLVARAQSPKPSQRDTFRFAACPPLPYTPLPQTSIVVAENALSRILLGAFIDSTFATSRALDMEISITILRISMALSYVSSLRGPYLPDCRSHNGRLVRMKWVKDTVRLCTSSIIERGVCCQAGAEHRWRHSVLRIVSYMNEWSKLYMAKKLGLQ